MRCTWVATTGDCKPVPEDCPTFAGLLPSADCACSRSKAASSDLTNAVLSNSNLGGLGPGSGAQEFRIQNAGASDTAESFDIVVTALSEYKAKFPQYNGLYKFGCINIGPPGQGGTDFPGQVDFKFSFYKAGTATPLELSEIHMAIFDLDGTSTASGIEFASSKGYKGYVTDAAPEISASRLPDGRTQFTGTGSMNNLPNPNDPLNMTLEQRRNSVMYFFVNVSSFTLTFGVEQAPSNAYIGNGRYLFFDLKSSLNDRCGD